VEYDLPVNLQRLFAWEDWANHLEVETLRTATTPRALTLLSHIIGAQWLWYARLRGEKARMPAWPELTLDDCERSLDLLRGHWSEYVETAPLEESITYTNSKGEEWTSRVDDVLAHVVLHGSYHRGQIAAALRGAELEPAYTDFIQCTRIGAI